MLFEKNHIYHIYNQGNNRQKVFFNRENYLFFLTKMNEYLLPYCDILAWCLMSNHFHWMVYVRESKSGIERMSLDQPVNGHNERNLNDSIAILLRSYTRAINKQNNSSGSLFRQKTKADCITNPQEVSPSYYNLSFCTLIRLHDPDKEYPQACFNYIHINPVKAKLVKNAEDWEFSSYPDIRGLRDGQLVNRERIAEFELTLNSQGDLKSPCE